jgi:predicted helicase
MTATPRYFTGRLLREAREADFEVVSMDDHRAFGPVFHRLGFSEAIARGLLSDYRVVVIGIDHSTYRDWVKHRQLVTTNGTVVTDARTLASQIGFGQGYATLQAAPHDLLPLQGHTRTGFRPVDDGCHGVDTSRPATEGLSLGATHFREYVCGQANA